LFSQRGQPPPQAQALRCGKAVLFNNAVAAGTAGDEAGSLYATGLGVVSVIAFTHHLFDFSLPKQYAQKS
jgi:hypothetical protein